MNEPPPVSHASPSNVQQEVEPQAPSWSALLDRPRADRAREFRYRLGQAVVFGLPVIALEQFGHHLGGPESDRWVGILEALLAGWVVYVGAAGLAFEGIVRLAVQ